MKTTEKLYRALEKADAPQVMLNRAKNGAYDDYLSESATPIFDLITDCKIFNLPLIAQRARDGDFDGTQAEADAWMASPDGQATIAKLYGKKK